MEYGTEIVNISKIEDGFFIGDKYCGTNIDVIIQFKITHIINTCGNQILNQFETLGIKYFTLNWQENPNQILFDSKDEIQTKLVSFIEEALTKGEGLLVHSMRGINRPLVIVVVYFMKKFCWSLKKCLEFIKIKVKNGKIEKYYLKQLESYEKRIKRKMSKEWYNLTNVKSDEEMMIRNTYLNSLLKENGKNNKNKFTNMTKSQYKIKYNTNHHVSWGIINNQTENDLFLKQNINDIDAHIRLKPEKKCIKTENPLNEDSDTENIKNYINNNLNKYMSNNIIKENNFVDEKNDEMKSLINLGLNMKIVDKINQISNNFNNLNMPNQRPKSAEQKVLKNNMIKIKNNNKKKYDFDKLSNYFDKLERKEKEKMAQNKNYKKLILKQSQSHPFNKINKNNNIDNSRGKRNSSFDKNNNNNKKGFIKINRQYIYPDKIINNSININMINYITNSSNQQMPFNKNNFLNNSNFSLYNNNYDPYTFFNKDEEINPIPQQNFNKIQRRNLEDKMNNSANNFYNYNSLKVKDGINNNYYNVMGQSFNLNPNKNKTYNKKTGALVKDDKKTRIYLQKNSFVNRYNSYDDNVIRANNKNAKRTTTPNNLLPKRKGYSNSINNNIKSDIINYNDYTNNNKYDESYINNNFNSDIQFYNKSFVLNQKNQRNQCKFIQILNTYFYLI